MPEAAASAAMRSRFTIVYSVRKILVKPRLGRRRCSGIWPPSKPRIRLEPERDPCPLWPRPDVLPVPDPMPRPMRFLFRFAFFGARRLERFIVVLAQRPPEFHRRTRMFLGVTGYGLRFDDPVTRGPLTLFHNPHQVRNRLDHAPY